VRFAEQKALMQVLGSFFDDVGDGGSGHISEVLQMTNGLIAGKCGAAKTFGLPASTLRNRIKKFAIKSKWRS
jgi:transcriptional regulator with GAF, ATPase, and Fis domain